MTKYTFHLFGIDDTPSLTCPESVSLFWMLNSPYCKHLYKHIEIVFSNNTDLSPTNTLPLLIVSSPSSSKKNETEEQVSRFYAGFADILQYLLTVKLIKDTRHPLNDNQDVSFTLDFLAALQFLCHDFKCMTLYQLYLNKTNYTEFTRKQFSKLFYWPAWYTAPLKIRSNVQYICDRTLQLEYLPTDDNEIEEGLENRNTNSTHNDVTDSHSLPHELVNSQSLRLSLSHKKNKLQDLKSWKHHIQYCNKLVEMIDEWCTFDTTISDPLRILELYLLANLYIQFTLPNGANIITHLKQSKGDEWVSKIDNMIRTYSSIENKLSLRKPSFTEQGNMIMSVYHKLKYYSNYI